MLQDENCGPFLPLRAIHSPFYYENYKILLSHNAIVIPSNPITTPWAVSDAVVSPFTKASFVVLFPYLYFQFSTSRISARKYNLAGLSTNWQPSQAGACNYLSLGPVLD